MKKFVLDAIACGVLFVTGCRFLDDIAASEEIVAKETVFARANGKVKGIELKKTENGKYIGPDGKAFASKPPDDVIAKNYVNSFFSIFIKRSHFKGRASVCIWCAASFMFQLSVFY